MEFLRVPPGNSPLEPIGVDHLYPGKGFARKMTETLRMLGFTGWLGIKIEFEIKALLNLCSYRIHGPELCLIVNGGLSNTCEDTCSPSNCRISISAPM